MASYVVFDRATYSASVFDSVTVDCRFEFVSSIYVSVAVEFRVFGSCVHKFFVLRTPQVPQYPFSRPPVCSRTLLQLLQYLLQEYLSSSPIFLRLQDI